jgi:hypothetical protein
MSRRGGAPHVGWARKLCSTMGAGGEKVDRLSALLHEAAETHHRVFRIQDGADDDWASWYSSWLTELSELPELVDRRPVRSELTYMLVSLDKEYQADSPAEPWERFYARRLLEHFSG